MSDAILANGMTFAHRTSAVGVTPKVFTEIGECLSVTPPNPTRAAVDTSHLKSPDNTREYKGGMIEPGESNVVLHYTPGVRDKVDALFGSDDLDEFRITYPDTSTETFFGFLTGKSTEGGEIDGKLTLNVPIKISGLPVYQEPA